MTVGELRLALAGRNNDSQVVVTTADGKSFFSLGCVETDVIRRTNIINEAGWNMYNSTPRVHIVYLRLAALA